MRAVIFALAGLESLLLSSCFIVRVPLNVTSAVLTGTAKAGSKAASATKDAFTKSDEEKEEEEKKKKLKDDAEEKKKKKDDILKQNNVPGQPGQPPAQEPQGSGDQIPYHPSITPAMLPKLPNGQPREKEVTPTPVPPGY
ncbi:MAG: hypothetical protein JWO82_4343 [Akkermansiaceae bacterium]|nr:hypothetical protein [Akkermansiaceae bacterium]